jgi:hypothetical protein
VLQPPPPLWVGHESRSRTRRGPLRWLAGLVTCALIGAGIYALERPAGPSYPSQWDPRVAAIAAFVQQDRGLEWKHPVNVEFVDSAEFTAKVGAGEGRAAEAQQVLEAGRAVGLLWGSADLDQAERSLAVNDVVGLYVPKDKTLFIKGQVLTPYVKDVVAHELTHALQDQYFPLGRLKAGPNDSESAATALIEGDAVRVQDDYARSLPAAQQAQLAQEEQQGVNQAGAQNAVAAVPTFLSDMAEFPYTFGPVFVRYLLAEGGNSQVDAAFRSPPSLDRQIIDPATYFPGQPVPSVSLPPLPRGAKVLQAPSGFGEFPLLETLGYEAGFAPAYAAAQQWRADSWEVYSASGRACISLSVLAGSGAGAGVIESAARQWAAAMPGARVSEVGAVVHLASCDPGASWRPRHSLDAASVLSGRAQLMAALLQDGAPLNLAVCSADRVTSSMPPATLAAAASASQQSDPSIAALKSAVVTALRACRG